MLTTGDVENNVHMAGTLRMAEALIKANKRFDFFIFPGQRHGFGNMNDYWAWLRAEYFVNVSYDALGIFENSKEKDILQNLTSFSLNRSF